MPKPLALKEIAPHPLRRYASLYIAASVIYVVLAAFLLFGIHHTNVPLLAVCVLLSAWFLGRGLYNRSIGVGAQLVNRAYNLVSTGRLREAETLLDAASVSAPIRYIRQVIATQRALIAMRRGDIPGGMAHADAAIAIPLGMNRRDGQRIQRVGARAIRALLRAAAGEREGALADIEEVRADPLATVEPLARVEVARAVLLEKSGD